MPKFIWALSQSLHIQRYPLRPTIRGKLFDGIKNLVGYPTYRSRAGSQIDCAGDSTFKLQLRAMKCLLVIPGAHRNYMLHVEEHGDRGPLIVMIHWLGGSARTWRAVSEGLSAKGMRCVAVDLPGFGHESEVVDFSIPAMVKEVIETIRLYRKADAAGPWFLAGHSMGGKLSSIVARSAEDGAEGLRNLRGIVLLSPSPPGPEPMDEKKREEIVKSLGQPAFDAGENCSHAEKFVDDNTGKLPLLDDVRQRSVDDVLRMNPKALIAWMKIGSNEDWSGYVGILSTPALILSGTEESELGPTAQAKHTLPHFARATSVALEGGGHLAPLERPLEVIDRMTEFIRDLVTTLPATSPLGPDFGALIASDQTSPQTRNVLMARLELEHAHASVLSSEELRTLRAVVERVIPGSAFDLAARLDGTLAQGMQDGWRFDTLPTDTEAWKKGLASLDAAAKRMFGVPFIALDSARQDTLLKQAQDGELDKGLLASLRIGATAESLNATQMRDWFQDVRGQLVKIYVADPRTMERIAFTGFADQHGFTQIRLSEQEEFEI